jgi:hypothetical protein
MKNIFFVIVFLFFSLCISGQDEFSPKITLGVRGGICHSNIYFDPGISSRAIDVPGSGFFINYISEPHLGVQVEMNFVTLGWKDKTDSTGTYRREMKYQQFPFLTHIELGQKLVKVTFDLGPYIAFHQGFTEEYDRLLRINNPYDTIILGERNYYGVGPVKNYDYGFLGSIGVAFDTKVGIFSIDARYSNGLVNVFKKYPKGNFSFSYHQSYFVGLSYSCAFKLKPHKKKNYKVVG